jgi:hypothetical protein
MRDRRLNVLSRAAMGMHITLPREATLRCLGSRNARFVAIASSRQDVPFGDFIDRRLYFEQP